MYELLFFLLSGAFVGLLAGALGVGGGGVIIPIVVLILGYTDTDPDLLMRIAIATSFSIIVFSSGSSILSHLPHKNILWKQLKVMLPSVIIGVLIGSFLIKYVSNDILKIFFCIFLTYTIYTLLKTTDKPQTKTTTISSGNLLMMGGFIGFISSFIGIAGGSLSVPVLNKVSKNIRSAIASSSVIGFTIAIVGVISSIYSGWHLSNLPKYSLGYIYLPATLSIAVISVLTAPIGVKISHKLTQTQLKRIFALFLLIVLIQFLYEIFI